MKLLWACCLLVLCCGSLVGRATAAEANWIWSPENGRQATPIGDCYFRLAFDVEKPTTGQLQVTADNGYQAYLNGRRLGSGNSWNALDTFELEGQLLAGRNLLAIKATNPDGPGGLVARLTVERAGQPPLELLSDAQWKTSLVAENGWRKLDFDDARWAAAHVIGPLAGTAPWRGAVKPGRTVRREPPRAPEKFELRDGDRVVLLGGTLVEREQSYGYFEAALLSRFPGKKITVRNLGWSGDTVWGEARAGFGTPADGFKALQAQLKAAEPTVILAAYGSNEAFAGAEGLDHFADGLAELVDVLQATKARVVLLTPTWHEAHGKPLPDATPHNDAIKLYAEAITTLAAERGLLSFNLLTASVVAPQPPASLWQTDNGLHLSAYGYWRTAPKILAVMGLPDDPIRIELDNLGKVQELSGAKVSEIERTPTGLRFQVRYDYLPQTKPPAGTPELTIVNREGHRTLRVHGLTGDVSLQIDGRLVDTFSAEDWDNGMVGLPTPELEQAEKLRRQIVAKNELFFHRWRPQNETYLFGFRKHEQGKNAAEIPQFDPLIRSKDARISELATPLEHEYELIQK